MTETQLSKELSVLSKLTPAIAALVAAYIAKLVTTSSALPDFGLLVGALAAILEFVAATKVGSSLRAQITALILIVVLSAMGTLGVAAVVGHHLEAPGRHALKEAQRWGAFVDDEFETPKRLETEEGSFGTGYGEAKDGTLLLHGESETSQAVPWTLYEGIPPDRDFYAEVQATLKQGPDDIACGLIFGFQNADSWWAMRLVDTNRFLVSRFEGIRNNRLDARTFFGLVDLPYANIRDGAKLAVSRRGDQYTFYVDNRYVTALSAAELLHPSGSVAPYAIDTATLYRASYECTFQSLHIYVAPTANPSATLVR